MEGSQQLCLYISKQKKNLKELHSKILFCLFLIWSFKKANLVRNILFPSIQHSSEDVSNHMLLKLSFLFLLTTRSLFLKCFFLNPWILDCSLLEGSLAIMT